MPDDTRSARHASPGARWSAKLLMLSAASLCACSTSTTLVGQRFPPREDGCTIDFLYQRPPGGEYQAVAYIHGSNFIPPTFTPSLKEMLRPKACRAGGDLVVMEQYNEGDLGRMDDSALFAVYRRVSTR